MHTLRPHPGLTEWDSTESGAQESLSQQVTRLTAVGDRLFFSANDGQSGQELWVSDGTLEGTGLLELSPGSAGSDPSALTALGDRLFFSALDAQIGRELGVSDGTADGTWLLDLNPGPEGSDPGWLTATGDWLYCSAKDAQSGRELGVSDGSTAMGVKD